VEQVTNLSCGVKWVNDVLLEGKKLCGILTELAVNDRGEPDFVIVGIGLNVSQTPADFGPDLSPIATSLGQHLPEAPDRAQLAAALLEELDRLWTGAGEGYLEEYRRRCLTVGRPVRLLRPQGETDAQALAVNPDFSLQVRLPDGRETAVTTGEVSVRGLLGYT
jgi:BirA family biotin operon repressor/biotin-[acetyl-CoA-carboxylase] ligase